MEPAAGAAARHDPDPVAGPRRERRTRDLETASALELDVEGGVRAGEAPGAHDAGNGTRGVGHGEPERLRARVQRGRSAPRDLSLAAGHVPLHSVDVDARRRAIDAHDPHGQGRGAAYEARDERAARLRVQLLRRADLREPASLEKRDPVAEIE